MRDKGERWVLETGGETTSATDERRMSIEANIVFDFRRREEGNNKFQRFI